LLPGVIIIIIIIVIIIIVIIIVVKGCTNRGQQVARAANFLWRLLIFVGPQYGTFVMLFLRRLDFFTWLVDFSYLWTPGLSTLFIHTLYQISHSQLSGSFVMNIPKVECPHSRHFVILHFTYWYL